MNILFDVYIANPKLPDLVTPAQNIVLTEIYSFVKERVAVLKDQIEMEEIQRDIKEQPAIVIYLRTKQIQPREYSPQLTRKIIDCFSESDIKYMWLRVDKALYDLLY